MVEADDEGLYVLKFRAAGQGRKALIAELIVGDLARAVGLQVPEIVLMDLDVDLSKTEGDHRDTETPSQQCGAEPCTGLPARVGDL